MNQSKEVTVGDSLVVKKPARLSPLGFFMALPPVLVILCFIGGPILLALAFSLGFISGPNRIVALIGQDVFAQHGKLQLDILHCAATPAHHLQHAAGILLRRRDRLSESNPCILRKGLPVESGEHILRLQHAVGGRPLGDGGDQDLTRIGGLTFPAPNPSASTRSAERPVVGLVRNAALGEIRHRRFIGEPRSLGGGAIERCEQTEGKKQGEWIPHKVCSILVIHAFDLQPTAASFSRGGRSAASYANGSDP